MSDTVLLSTLAVLAASYLLVLLAARNRRSPLIQDYLYGGNRPLFAMSSGLGTVLSVSIAFTALLSGGYVFGWQILFSILPGAVTGLILLLIISRSRLVGGATERSSLPKTINGQKTPASYLSFLVDSKRPASALSLLGIPILIYGCLMVMEFSVVRVTTEKLFHLKAPGASILLVLIAAVCFFYVFIGGYLGVLLTDHFQLLVIVAFLGSVMLHLRGEVSFPGIPSPFASQLEWPSAWYMALLHVGSFAASMSIVLASPDNWIRTIGTLNLRTARFVLTGITVAASGAAAVPILIGSSFHLESGVSAGLGGELSLYLLRKTLTGGNVTLTALFAMALACVVMTTIDTYLITIQQLYYELVSQFHATTPRLYALEYFLKWKQVRAVGFLGIVMTLALSFLIPARFIYIFGVGSLSLIILLAPLPLMLLSGVSQERPWIVEVCPAGLAVSFLITPVLMWTTHNWLAPVGSHLYMLTVAAAVATVLGYGGAVLLALYRMRKLEREATR